MLMIQEYIYLFVIFMTVTFVLHLLIFFIGKEGMGFIRQSSYLLYLWSLFVIVFATIILFNFPLDFNPERRVMNLIPLRWLWEGGVKQRILSEIRPNIMIFIPLGFLTPAVFKKTRTLSRTALVVLSVTFGVEFFQYFIGRLFDVDDLMANLLGGIIGYGVFKVFCRLFAKGERWNEFIGSRQK